MSHMILYHCKQLDEKGRTVREFDVVADTANNAKGAAHSVLVNADSPSEKWTIDVYPLHAIAAMRYSARIQIEDTTLLPLWGGK